MASEEEEEKIQITNWGELSQSADELANAALELQAETPVVDLADLKAEITKILNEYSQGVHESTVKPEEARVFTVLSDQLRFSRGQVEQIPAEDPLATEIVLNNVESHLRSFLSAGPHGPGAGRPRTYAPGTTFPGRGRPLGTKGGQGSGGV